MSQNKSKLEKMLETAPLKTQDDSLKENASAAEEVGLEVTVTREYDGVGLSGGRECTWCKNRECKNASLAEAYEIGAFQRHPGCGCIVEYTSNKGVRTIQTGKYSGWNYAEELEKRKSIGLDSDFFADELVSRVVPYLDIDETKLLSEAMSGGSYCDTFARADGMTRPELEKDIRGYLKATEKHEWKIRHPELYMTREDPNDPIARSHAVSHWENDRRRNARITRIEIEVWRNKFGS